jgi:hypothetical protein
MIPSQRQHQPPLLRMLIHLSRQRLRHRRHSLWLLHAAIHRVFRGVHQVLGVVVHDAVVVDRVAEVARQGRQEARVQEGGGRRVDACFALGGGKC